VQPLPETIRIFPLGEVVLFPDTLLPLHVFEPRYRKLLADSLAGDRLIGMVLIRSGDAAGSPDVYPVGCAGRIVRHEPLSDGRSFIVLRGDVRFRIRRELAVSEPYRVIEPQTLYEAPVLAEHMRAWRAELEQRVHAYLRAVGGDLDSLEKVFHRQGLERVVNFLSATLPFEVVEKQSLLECSTVELRCRRLCDLVEFKTAEAKLGLDATREADS
jgi:Lon protease-like protein